MSDNVIGKTEMGDGDREFVKALSDLGDVAVYIHVDEDGNRSLIVDIDTEFGEDDSVRVYVNDGRLS